jgi:hypothetical protein
VRDVRERNEDDDETKCFEHDSGACVGGCSLQ